MIIGIPKEIKNNENRVALTPAGAQELVKRGHTVYVQATAGVPLLHQKMHGTFCDSLLFTGIDRLCRIAAYTRSSVFHFYKDKVFSVSCNQIDLSQPAAIIICHNLVSQKFKISTCFPFIAGACPAIILLIHNYV